MYNLINFFLKFKEAFTAKFREWRQKLAVHPKVVVWRLHLFGVSPFLSMHIIKIFFASILAFVILGSFHFFSWRAPTPFPEHSLITVERGESLSQISHSFEEKGVVRSSFWLKVFMTLIGGDDKVIAGDYYFPESKNVFQVVFMLRNGQFGLIPIRTVIQEGLSSYEMKNCRALIAKNLWRKLINKVWKAIFFPTLTFLCPIAMQMM
jgi:cell division protein YceG involved in septum cleavage